VTPEEARRRFAAARVARLATVGADSQPHVVPIVFAVADETIYSVVDAKPKRTTELRRLQNVSSNPRASVLADYYDDTDWDALWWARADGTARVVGLDESEAASAVQLLARRYPQQRPRGPVLAVDVQRWSGWAARAAPPPDGGFH
jgi:PPOX class probable F420-dependent enzyme